MWRTICAVIRRSFRQAKPQAKACRKYTKTDNGDNVYLICMIRSIAATAAAAVISIRFNPAGYWD